MRFDYPVLALINTNVINGHKKQVDSVRLILSKAALHSAWEAAAPGRGLLGWGGIAPSSPLRLLFPQRSPARPSEALPP